MLRELVFNKTSIPAVLKSLDAAMLRSRVISNNIANVTTPGYQRLDVEFEGAFRKALDHGQLMGRRTSDGHMPLGRLDLECVNPMVEKPNDPVLAGGVNNVDIDEEMAKLAETQIMYNYGAHFVKGRIRTIDAAIMSRSITQ